jgi:peptidoglycan/xylan/chitin deacetylase (PgdA/CDA1 family)
VTDEENHGEDLPYWRCPSCGAVTRARMADHPLPASSKEIHWTATTLDAPADSPAARTQRLLFLRRWRKRSA